MKKNLKFPIVLLGAVIFAYTALGPLKRNQWLFQVGLGGWDPDFIEGVKSALAKNDGLRMRRICNTFLIEPTVPKEDRLRGIPNINNRGDLESFGVTLGYSPEKPPLARLLQFYDEAPYLDKTQTKRGYSDPLPRD